MAHTELLQDPLDNERKILIAIDFGTTFTGVAWAQTARSETQNIVDQWPNENDLFEGATNEKVPTEMSYTGTGTESKWGFQISETEPRHQRFKLALDPEALKKVSHLASRYPDPRCLPVTHDRPATKLTIDYLTFVRKHVLEVLKTKLTEGVLEITPIEYVITVPAIWQDAAKYRTRSCAKQAGLGGNLQIISEPEAAVVYALDSIDPHTLEVGDTFVLCDAGGGTVDLITYTIEELKPVVKVSETVAGDGDPCGSTVLNNMFRVWLQENISSQDGWDDDTLLEAMDKFENNVKRKFAGGQEPVQVPVPGLASDRKKGIMRSKLTVPASVIRGIFDPVITTITTLINSQISKAPGPVKAVLLVGGFGQNPYLRESTKKIVGADIKVVQPAKGWTAIVRGALMRGLATAIPKLSRLQIGSRIARKSYGIETDVPFVNGKDQHRRKYFDHYSGFNRISKVHWLLKQADKVDEEDPITVPLFADRLVKDGRPYETETILLFHEAEYRCEPPRYANQGTTELVKLTTDLSTISNSAFPVKVGMDNKRYYCLPYEIRVKFSSAHIEYSMWYNDTCYGSVAAEYV